MHHPLGQVRLRGAELVPLVGGDHVVALLLDQLRDRLRGRARHRLRVLVGQRPGDRLPREDVGDHEAVLLDASGVLGEVYEVRLQAVVGPLGRALAPGSSAWAPAPASPHPPQGVPRPVHRDGRLVGELVLRYSFRASLTLKSLASRRSRSSAASSAIFPGSCLRPGLQRFDAPLQPLADSRPSACRSPMSAAPRRPTSVVALRRGPVKDVLQLLQIGVPDVLLDFLVREVVLAVGGSHDAVRLHDQRRLARQPVLQPDLLPRKVKGAVAGGRHLQLREARGRVGVQLQPGELVEDLVWGGGGGAGRASGLRLSGGAGGRWLGELGDHYRHLPRHHLSPHLIL